MPVAAVDRHSLVHAIRRSGPSDRRPDRRPDGRDVPSVPGEGRSKPSRFPGAGLELPEDVPLHRAGSRTRCSGNWKPPRGSHRAAGPIEEAFRGQNHLPRPLARSGTRISGRGEIDRSHLGSINFGLSERPKHSSASRTDSTSVASARKASETVTPRFTGPWNPSAGSGCVGLLPRRLPPCGGRNRPRCSAAPGPAEYLPTIIEPCCSPGAKEGSGRPRPRPWPARLVGCGLRSGSGVAVLRQEVRPQGDAESEAEEDADRPEHHPAQ